MPRPRQRRGRRHIEAKRGCVVGVTRMFALNTHACPSGSETPNPGTCNRRECHTAACGGDAGSRARRGLETSVGRSATIGRQRLTDDTDAAVAAARVSVTRPATRPAKSSMGRLEVDSRTACYGHVPSSSQTRPPELHHKPTNPWFQASPRSTGVRSRRLRYRPISGSLCR